MAPKGNQDSPAKTVYFFTSRSPAGADAVRRVTEQFPQAEWHVHRIETQDERRHFESGKHAPDIIISFLNPYIIPPFLLEAADGHAYNVHPALPEHPGRDPQHFAFYEGDSVNGATLHRMDAMVDSGEIVDVIEVPFDRSEGVMRFIEVSEALSIELLVKWVPRMLSDEKLPATRRVWRADAKTTRKKFLEMCRIDTEMTGDEVRRRIEAFFNPAYRTVHVDLHGYRFVYEPGDPSE